MSRKHNTDAAAPTAAAPEQATPEAPAPEATPTPRALTPAERRAALIAKRDAHRAAGGLWRNAAGNPDARGLPCGCGCGAPTHRDEALFLSGHDARMRAAVLALPSERQTIDAVPFVVRAHVREAGPVAGLLYEAETGRLIDVKAGGSF